MKGKLKASDTVSQHPDIMKAAAASLLLLGVCVLLLSAPTVSAGLILEIPPDPVPAGSDVTMCCKQSNGDIITAYFFFNGSHVENKNKSEFIITNVQQSDEGLYSCATDVFGESPQSFLRVRDPPPPLPSSPSVSWIRVICHLLAFCPYCICTILLLSICCSRSSGTNSSRFSHQHHPDFSALPTGNKHAVSMETPLRDAEYDDIVADVTTEHVF